MHVLCQQQTWTHAAEQIHVTKLYVTSDHILVCNKNPLLLCQRLHTVGAILALGTINYVPCMNFHLSTYKRKLVSWQYLTCVS